MIDLKKIVAGYVSEAIDALLETPRFRKRVEQIAISALGLGGPDATTTTTTAGAGATSTSTGGASDEAPARRQLYGKIPDLNPSPAALFSAYSRYLKLRNQNGEAGEAMTKEAFFAAEMERRRAIHAGLNGSTTTAPTSTPTSDTASDTAPVTVADTAPVEVASTASVMPAAVTTTPVVETAAVAPAQTDIVVTTPPPAAMPATKTNTLASMA